jgi:pyridoxine 5-phosphate synthase
MSKIPRLGVNIDHIASLRQARRGFHPDPAKSLPILKQCGVDQVTCHLREDRRHIQDRDLRELILRNILPVNLEMAPTEEMVGIAIELKPVTITLVPEKREEITTEGGLDCHKHLKRLEQWVPRLKERGIRVSFFLDPDLEQIALAQQLGGDAVELHTGVWCEQYGKEGEEREFCRLQEAAQYTEKGGLSVFAGHGLDAQNLPRLLEIREIVEYNIGHSIIARAVFVGLELAVKEIINILKRSGSSGFPAGK